MSQSEPCIRGCLTPRRHVFTEGEGRTCAEDCRGCLPRPAEHGRLCFACHRRWDVMLSEAPGQHAILLADIAPAYTRQLTAETTARVGHHRLEDGETWPSGLYAKASGSAPQESAPMRVECADLAQELADWLSQLVERLCDDYALTGPERMLSGPESDPRRCGHPPWRFAVATACEWLRGRDMTLRVESVDRIADDYEELRMLMARAHALRPWREEATRLPGITCPHCQRASLVRYGGREDVECQTPWCRSIYPWERYAVWVRRIATEKVRGWDNRGRVRGGHDRGCGGACAAVAVDPADVGGAGAARAGESWPASAAVRARGRDRGGLCAASEAGGCVAG